MRSTEVILRAAVVWLVCGFAPAADANPRQCPATPGQPGWLEQQMVKREESVAREREAAIRLLEAFLVKHPSAKERAEALFRLAELHWEEAEARFLARMRSYDEELEAFRSGQVKARPGEPRIDLSESLKIYEEILEKHPGFARTDTVLYLYGFGLNEQGDEQTALAIYRTLLKRFPSSAFVPDAHLAIGEYHFAKGDFPEARIAYEEVLKHDTPLLDLALYKTAWCHFKEGHAKEAAKRFRKVLQRSREQREHAAGRVETSATQLEKEALEDLSLTFSESGGAREAYRFMKQVGGEEYSIRVLQSLGDVFFRQARYNKAIESFRMLVDKFPLAPSGPEHQDKIAEAYQREGKMEEAVQERLKLAERYGPGSSWAENNQGSQDAMETAARMSEESLRFVATYRHKQAQETRTKKTYRMSADAYQDYLKRFGDSRHAPLMHFNLGEVFYKLAKYDQAAFHYGHAAQKSEDQKVKKDAAYAAVLSFDHLRKVSKEPEEPSKKKQKLTQGEKGFVAAVDEFGRLAPDDAKLPQLRFEVGKVYYFRAQFLRASTHFLGVVQNHPDDPFAEPAADLALDCFARSRSWSKMEKRARRFWKSGMFKNKELGKKLPGIITAAIFRNATRLAKAEKHGEAAEEFQRLAGEFPGDRLAPKALFLAGVSLEQAGEKQKALATYQHVTKAYPKHAAEATFVIAGIFERQYDYEQAARHYSDFAHRFGSDERAPEALLQAALLHQARRDFDQEASVLSEFTRLHPGHAKATEAMFRAGLALERAGRHAKAEQIFSSYLRKHAERDKRVREATLHLGQAKLTLGRRGAARGHFERCGQFRPARPPRGTELAAAAQCLFLLGEMVHDDYKKIRLRPPKSRLVRLLKQKASLLKKAENLFTRVVAAGHMEWASAALYRIGDMYAQFAQAIYKAPSPKELSQKELEVYRQELQSLAFPIEDKALTAFTLSFEMAIKHGYYSRWSQRTIEMLRKLDPGKFTKEEELRPGTQWVDSFTTFPLLLKPLPQPQPRPGQDRPGGGA